MPRARSRKKFPKRITPVRKIHYCPALWDTTVMDYTTIIDLSALGALSDPTQPQSWHGKIIAQIKPFFEHAPSRIFSDEWFYNNELAMIASYRHIREYLHVIYVLPKKTFFEQWRDKKKTAFVDRYMESVIWFTDFLFYIDIHLTFAIKLSKNLLLLSLLNSLPQSFVIKFNRFTDPFDSTVGPTWARCPKEESAFTGSLYLSIYSSVNDMDMDTFVYIPNYMSLGKSFHIDPTLKNLRSVMSSSYSHNTGILRYKSRLQLLGTHISLILVSASFGIGIVFLMKLLYFPYLDLSTSLPISNFLSGLEKLFDPLFSNTWYKSLSNLKSVSENDVHSLNLEKHLFYNPSNEAFSISSKDAFENVHTKNSLHKPNLYFFPENETANTGSLKYSLFHNFTSLNYEEACRITKFFLPPVLTILRDNDILHFNSLLKGEWNHFFQNGLFLDRSIVLYFYADDFVKAEKLIERLISSFDWYLDLSPKNITLEGIESKKIYYTSTPHLKPTFSDHLNKKFLFGVRFGNFS